MKTNPYDLNAVAKLRQGFKTFPKCKGGDRRDEQIRQLQSNVENLCKRIEQLEKRRYYEG